MIELIDAAARRDPSQIAAVTNDVATSYAELSEQAHRVSTWLRRRSITRFGVVDFEATPVLALLAGAADAGAEACLYPPVEAGEISVLAERFDHDLLVTDRDDLADLGLTLEPTSGWAAVPPDPAPPTTARPHLVLTTGTTGAPRGVRHDWTRLLRGVARVRPAADQRWLLAYGIHQFAGLQILLHVLAAGATLVAPAPRRPREGLDAMRRLGVTHASATPTYWRFLLAELRADAGPVPSLRQVTLGGEAVPAPVLAQIRSTFPDASISQIYAASEFGSSGSMRDGRPGLSTDVLDRGEEADVDMRVVDGELWVRSTTGMLGYYGEPAIDPDGWRSTGDLVEIVGDRIEFRGRSSEIINVGGVKVHPLPIEERIGAVESVDVARVWGRPNPLTGAIVAVDVVAAPGSDIERVREEIRAACEDLPPAARPRSIRFVDDVATLGSKILRRDDS